MKVQIFIIVDKGCVSVYSDSKIEVEIIDLDERASYDDQIAREKYAQEIMAEYVEAG